MPKLEGFPQPANNNELPPETMHKIQGFNFASRVWSAFEKGDLAPVPEADLTDEVISSLEFLKEKHIRPYTKEQEAEQFQKVDAYIAQLKGEVLPQQKPAEKKKGNDAENPSVAA